MAQDPESIRKEIEQTREAMSEKIERIEWKAQDTVDTVKAKSDPRRFVRQYPWRIFGGSLIVGLLLGHASSNKR